jgi:hypothetical protein
MAISDSTKVTLRSETNQPLSHIEMDENFKQIKNVITDSTNNSDSIQDIDERLVTREEQVDDLITKPYTVAALSSLGYSLVGDYAAGIEITNYNQIVRDSSGEFWRVSGSTALPYTTTGAGLPEGGAFVAVGDAALRQELGSNTAGQGSDLIAHTGTADTVTEALDKRTIYVGSVAELEGLDAGDLAEGLTALVSGIPFVYRSGEWRPSAGVVTPEIYGAVGDGVADDGPAFRAAEAALYEVGGGTIRCAKDRVYAGGTVGTAGIPSILPLRKNTTLYLNGSVLKTHETVTRALYSCVGLIRAVNCWVENGTLTGNRYNPLADLVEEAGLGISLNSAIACGGRNLLCNEHGGDGLYFGIASYDDNAPSVGCYFENIECDDNVRQGISIIALHSSDFVNVTLSNSAGGSLQTGLDIEPDNSNQTVVGVKFKNLVVKSCAEAGIVISTRANTPAERIDVTFENTLVEDCPLGIFSPSSAIDSPTGSVAFSGRTRIKNSSSAGLFITANDNTRYVIDDLEITGTNNSYLGQSGADPELPIKNIEIGALRGAGRFLIRSGSAEAKNIKIRVTEDFTGTLRLISSEGLIENVDFLADKFANCVAYGAGDHVYDPIDHHVNVQFYWGEATYDISALPIGLSVTVYNDRRSPERGGNGPVYILANTVPTYTFSPREVGGVELTRCVLNSYGAWARIRRDRDGIFIVEEGSGYSLDNPV